MAAEKCVEVLQSKSMKHGLSLKDDIVSVTTDGATVMQKAGKLIGVNQQLCSSHGIQLRVIEVVYQKQKQKNSNTVDTETLVSDFEEGDTDNEDNDNLTPNDGTIFETEKSIQKGNDRLKPENFSDSEFDLISRTASALVPIKLDVEVLCQRF
ncbi:hypothetical protein TNCV_582731 [Trichonephila clavipes]|nr:hypothetical protein TNCV_582731 [Trichonephila clavipes]